MPISSYGRKLAPPGDEAYCRVNWTGPASYTQITAGSPPTGGDSIVAKQFGANRIVGIVVLGTYTGSVTAVPVRLSSGNWALMWRALKTATVGGQSQTSGAEVAASTDLSGQTLVLQVETVTG